MLGIIDTPVYQVAAYVWWIMLWRWIWPQGVCRRYLTPILFPMRENRNMSDLRLCVYAKHPTPTSWRTCWHSSFPAVSAPNSWRTPSVSRKTFPGVDRRRRTSLLPCLNHCRKRDTNSICEHNASTLLYYNLLSVSRNNAKLYTTNIEFNGESSKVYRK